ncbi:MAG TPA: 2-phosphosulfolactate phosphatase [Bacteroidales bacterium]|nr:2-phosphosulfolactate phosphatase [Bacteroidales bacterium]HOK74396.1 2-phosphosulfolactate phosphatase [Bacteroidales bacterium]HOM41187.1 2-phosphosulfolactate phosphatase [Bacteroidales bacterium]HOU29622.1 2-phosphosulfolactate phosphatase [Bacteroidales bacterium]HPP92823.1 2-phosphosulfolactate phosphatase [Bacteroidales bacterium]
MEKLKLEVCLSPAMFHRYDCRGNIVVIIDVLRACSAICTAFENGAAEIIPVAEAEEAKEYKNRGYLVAAERDGFTLDFADFGNSPFNFTRERVEGKTIAYSTTNGTRIIEMTDKSYKTIIGAFLNISSVTEWILAEKKDVILFCAGWKDRFSLEDTVCAGAYASRLLESGLFTTICDSVHASLDIWEIARNDLRGYIEKAAQRSRLRDKGLDDCIDFCLTADITPVIPVVEKGKIVPLRYK